MSGIFEWLRRLFPKPLRVVVDGSGYRVNDQWCATQVEVRRALEALGLSESEIVAALKELNRSKYGHPGR